MTLRSSKLALATVVLAALVAGCGSDDDEGSSPQATAATTTAATTTAAGDLEGDYRRTLTAADIARTEDVRKEGRGQERPEPGQLTLTLRDGTLKMVDLGAKLTVLQDFSATSDGALRIGAYQRPEEGSFCGPDMPQTAAYTWKLAGDTLTLKAEQDGCADRDSSLTGEWKVR